MLTCLRRLNFQLSRSRNRNLRQILTIVRCSCVVASNLSSILPHALVGSSKHLSYCLVPTENPSKLGQLLNSQGPNDSDNPDTDIQEKLANLGSMIDELKRLVPNLLHKSFPKSLLLPDILLRLSPTHFELLNMILPNIQGHVSYYAACKAIQLFSTSVILNPQAQLHIQSIRTSNFPEPSTVFPDSTKIYIRWNTCSEGCVHLLRDRTDGDSGPDSGPDSGDSYSTSKAMMGAHRWTDFDPDKVLTHESSTRSVVSYLADLTKGLIGLKREDTALERVILGVFIFELSKDNSQVLVHTIEDMTVVERREEHGVEEKLRVC